MADNPLGRRRWIGQLIFAGLSLFIIFTHLIPLETAPPSFGGVSLQPVQQRGSSLAAGGEVENFFDPARWIAPDLLILLACVWVVRRPSFAPVWMIAVIFLLADMLFQRPPGLWTALTLFLTEVLRRRSRSMRTLPFMLEWGTVTVGITTISVVYWFTLSMVMVPQAQVGLALLQLCLTLIAYPAVVFVSYALFGVSRAAPGEVDALGHQL